MVLTYVLAPLDILEQIVKSHHVVVPHVRTVVHVPIMQMALIRALVRLVILVPIAKSLRVAVLHV